MRVSIFVLLLTAAVSCKATTPVIDPTPTPTPTQSVTPTRTPQPTLKAVRAVYSEAGAIVLYEVATDVVKTLATGDGLRSLRWYDEKTVAFAQDGSTSTALRLLDIETRSLRELITIPGRLLAYGFNKERTSVATLSDREGRGVLELRFLVGDMAVKRLTTIPRAAREFVLDDQTTIEFAPAGNRFLVVDTAANPSENPELSALQVRDEDGDLLFDIPANSAPTMATWGVDGNLYFRSNDGTRVLRSGKSSSSALSSQRTWFEPSVSGNGRFVAYDTGATSAEVRVRRINTRSGEVTDLGPEGRFRPVYARVDAVWMQQAQRCDPDCLRPVVGGPVVWSLNPQDGTERETAMTSLAGIAVWYEE